MELAGQPPRKRPKKVRRPGRGWMRPGDDQLIAERRTKAWNLRRDGASVKQIAEHLGISDVQVYHDLNAEMRDVRERLHEKIEDHIQIDLARIERWLLALAPAILKGDAKSILAGAKLLERKAKLLGTDAAVKHEVTGADGTPLPVSTTVNVLANMEPDALRARLQGLVEQLRALPEATVVEAQPAEDDPATVYARELAARSGKNGNGNG